MNFLALFASTPLVLSLANACLLVRHGSRFCAVMNGCSSEEIVLTAADFHPIFNIEEQFPAVPGMSYGVHGPMLISQISPARDNPVNAGPKQLVAHHFPNRVPLPSPRPQCKIQPRSGSAAQIVSQPADTLVERAGHSLVKSYAALPRSWQ